MMRLLGFHQPATKVFPNPAQQPEIFLAPLYTGFGEQTLEKCRI
jgi:hypothetical protein